MTENDFGDQYQPCRDGTFLDFYSDYHPDLYGGMAITLQPETVETQKWSHTARSPVVFLRGAGFFEHDPVR